MFPVEFNSSDRSKMIRYLCLLVVILVLAIETNSVDVYVTTGDRSKLLERQPDVNWGAGKFRIPSK